MTSEQRVADLERYAAELRAWLAVPGRRQTNPRGYADRERELARTLERLAIRRAAVRGRPADLPTAAEVEAAARAAGLDGVPF
jgi:hypothetical protein